MPDINKIKMHRNAFTITKRNKGMSKKTRAQEITLHSIYV